MQTWIAGFRLFALIYSRPFLSQFSDDPSLEKGRVKIMQKPFEMHFNIFEVFYFFLYTLFSNKKRRVSLLLMCSASHANANWLLVPIVDQQNHVLGSWSCIPPYQYSNILHNKLLLDPLMFSLINYIKSCASNLGPFHR